MKKLLLLGVATRRSEDVSNGSKPDNGQTIDQSPIRKQAREDRQRYMREYMRAYRLAHPGLSTPYVRKLRARKRDAD